MTETIVEKKMSISDIFYIGAIDYAIFTVMLCLSVTISIYFGYFKNKNNSIEEYMFGGRKMPVIPICLSVVASTLSSISLIAYTREIYYYGTVVAYASVGDITAYTLLYFFYIPVFYKQKFSSMFEYVEKRFSKSVRCLGSLIYAVTQLFFSLMVMYSACSAIAQVTPIPFYIFAPATCLLCTFYSVVGGLRGVVWADFFQALFMYISVITLNVIGFQNINSEDSIVDILKNGGRWNHFDFDPSFFTRVTMLSIYLAGSGLSTFNMTTNQGTMQRYLSLSSFKQARLVIALAALFSLLFSSQCIILSTVMYGTFYNCDPVLTGKLKDSNHIMIYYTVKTGMKLPGLIGLTLAGILSASLSSMSTMINSVSTNIFEDVLKPAIPWKLNNQQTYYFIKGIAFVCGLIITGGVFVVDPSGGIYQVLQILISLTGSLIVFIFGFGLFFRKANTKGVMAGCFSGLIVTLWLGIGTQIAISQGRIKYRTKFVTTEGCYRDNTTESFNITTNGYLGRVPVIFDEDLPYPYRISYNYFFSISVLVSTIVGVTVSLLTSDNIEVNEELLIPQLRRKNKTKTNKDYKDDKVGEDTSKQIELQLLNVYH